ncbi:phosphatase PAP2 family protein [Pseudoduganella sp. FT93W]|uniref:Phosphatase PAP2 family protein n=1 Tax=Duganella fentianensis TaxID=2692177 RepID=A0A845HVV3_9BURK|nr:phosphatase PAP2 family protein [Duganella fentianensis]MYN45544.1 phosphatase PAP2 family protein [Duganella fentianensis]
MMMWWHGLSMVGSLAVTAPIGVAIAIWLVAGRSWHLTAAWCALFGAGMALVVATKVAFMGWGMGVKAVEFAGFSGHAMRAAAVFPVAFFLLVRNRTLPWRVAATVAGVALAVLIAISRVYVEAHSVSEAVTGCILGLLVAASFIWYASVQQHMVMSRWLLLMCLPIVLIAPRVEPVPAEQWIAQLAMHLSGRDQTYTRAIWRKPKTLQHSSSGGFSL